MKLPLPLTDSLVPGKRHLPHRTIAVAYADCCGRMSGSLFISLPKEGDRELVPGRPNYLIC
jgi:hypothetical protein